MSERFLVFSGMRDEGAWLVEWVSWQRMLGFEILIGTNDSAPPFLALLDAFQDAGWLTWFAHRPGKRPPKGSAHRAMMKRPEVAATDWLLICDVDEFLVLHEGDGTVPGYLDRVGRAQAGIAFHWRNFGTSGWERYAPGLVHRQFTRCGPARMGPNIMVKTMVRDPLRFRRFTDHGPARVPEGWGEGREIIRDAALREIDRFTRGPHPVRYTDQEGITHATAQMNHYVLRSVEHFAMKKGRPSASALKDRYTDRFFAARDRNGQRDLSALAHGARFDAVHAEAMALPGVARLHHLNVADYVARLCAAAGTEPTRDPRWQEAMAAAERTEP